MTRPLHTRLAMVGAGFALVGLGTVALFVPVEPGEAAFAYLFGFATVFNAVVGTLFLLMIGNATNATWFVPLRRQCEHVIGALPALGVAFLPVMFWIHRLYSWADPALLTAFERPRVEAKAAWLDPRFFALRSVGYLAAIIAVAELLRHCSLRQDDVRDEARSRKLRSRIVAWSVGGLVLVGLTFTFASFDWFMSLEPAWYTDMYGVYTFSGALLAGLGLVGVLAALGRRMDRLPRAVGEEHWHALGRLQLAMVIFWAYIAWAHVLQHWIANEPAEQLWYIRRWAGGWQWCGMALVAVHFVLPFLVLLSRDSKRRPSLFLATSFWLLGAHVLDMFHLIWPAHSTRFECPPVTLAAVGGLGGLALATAALRAGGSRAVAVNDPLLGAGLDYESWS